MDLKFLNLIKYIFFSLIFIYSVHYLFNYFKNILTPKKTKDIISFQMKKYNEIINELINKKECEQDIDYSAVENDMVNFVHELNTDNKIKLI